MARLNQVAPETTVGSTKEMLDRVAKVVGRVPNMHQVFANSQAALAGYLQLSGALGHGKLSARDRELISLAVSEANGCEYCVSAHSTIGRMLGLSADQLRDARHAAAVDPRTDALLHFARRVLETKGRVSDAELAAFKGAGFDDEVVVEVIGNVVLNSFTNYTNNLAETTIDWPIAEKLEPVQA